MDVFKHCMIRKTRPTVTLIPLLIGVGLALADRVPAGPAPQAVLAIVNVAVVPMDSERILPAQTVVVRDHRIACLGTAMFAVRCDNPGAVIGDATAAEKGGHHGSINHTCYAASASDYRGFLSLTLFKRLFARGQQG
jgi:hypothetical protein